MANQSSEQVAEEIDLDTLNQLSTSHMVLMLLRVLNTSDLTFTFALLNHDTVDDVIRMCESLLDLDKETCELTLDQKTEVLGYIENMRCL